MLIENETHQQQEEGGAAPLATQFEQVQTAQAVALQHSANPLDLPSEQFQAGLDRRKANRASLMHWVRSALVEGSDFGRIPTRRGPSKPSLWKPGAEKICGMLGVTVHYPTLQEYEQAALKGMVLANIIIRCEIRDNAGRVIADGIGARSLKQDGGDLNKALKMAEKSAHIDATLRMAGLSEVFTQDLEDMNHGQNLEEATRNTRQSASQDRVSTPPKRPQPQEAPRMQRISGAQRRRLEARISELNLDRERVKSWLERASHGQLNGFEQLTPELYQQLDQRLDQWAAQ